MHSGPLPFTNQTLSPKLRGTMCNLETYVPSLFLSIFPF